MDFILAHYAAISSALAIAAAVFFVLKFVASFTKNKIDDVVVEIGDKLLEAITKKLEEEKAKRDAESKNG